MVAKEVRVLTILLGGLIKYIKYVREKSAPDSFTDLKNVSVLSP